MNFSFSALPSSVIASTGLEPKILDDAENAMSFSDAGRLLQACVSATRCPYFGLMVGPRSGTKDLGLVGQLMRNAPTLESKSFPGNCLKMPSLDCRPCDMIHRRSGVSKLPTFQPRVVSRADLEGKARKKPGLWSTQVSAISANWRAKKARSA
jgi:hypothetical protein